MVAPSIKQISWYADITIDIKIASSTGIENGSLRDEGGVRERPYFLHMLQSKEAK